MSDQSYDFRIVGSFDHQEVYDDGDRALIQLSVWECGFCFSLTNSPEQHWALHRGSDDVSRPPSVER